MNDTVATEDQEQPAGWHQRKARVADRDPGHRTSSGPADICSAPTEAGHMTVADQIVRSAKKVLAMEGRPHMTVADEAPKKCLPWRERLSPLWRRAGATSGRTAPLARTPGIPFAARRCGALDQPVSLVAS